MRRKVLYSTLLLLILSCSVDYEFNHSLIDEKERIVVNCILTPNSPIEVHLYKLTDTPNGYSCVGLRNAKILLKEGENILFDDLCNDSVLSLNYHVKSEFHYSIKVFYDNLPTVQAKTIIPLPIHCKTDFTSGEYYWDASQYKIVLDFSETADIDKPSLWITSYKQSKEEKLEQYDELYTNNVFVDKTNSVAGMEVKNEDVGSIYHNGFIRIKKTNIPFLEKLVFTPNDVSYLNDVNEKLNQEYILVKLIVGSVEYDRYNKSLYEQFYSIVSEQDISSVFYQPKSVFSNVDNGWGIFAGMNETKYQFTIPKENE